MLKLPKERITKFTVRLTEKRHTGLMMNKAKTRKSMELQIDEAIDKYLNNK